MTKYKVVKGQLWSQEHHLAPEVLNKKAAPQAHLQGICDPADSGVWEVELDNDCGCWMQIPGQKGSGKGRTGRTSAKEEAECLPLHKAAVDADRRSCVLPAVLQEGVNTARGGGNMPWRENSGQRLNTDRPTYDFCHFYYFSLLNRLTAIMKAQMPKTTFLKRGKSKNFQGNTLLTIQTKQTLEQSLRKHRMLAWESNHLGLL